ncbi:Bcr/CflA family multidrug efflux MFS transporter [Ammoniphilus sp. CFH 90114]|uniref:Bcr/CflA family multidrug efflux MFS transporter n=1 Tax=Ammoniphilus sp. CFH 90114 TaxID=2493665 RepID=UPI00100F1D0D|nr:Bcr/CflA family multidrug efflux MFS transporter [Ammoniphilus sp. CFH 90114]RXT15445.1 Bcr/CflA family multidrug efflux MFS transporter [Ammoniphilus sp. CFH 90114]
MNSLTEPSGSHRIKFALILGSLATIGPLSIDMYLPAFPIIAEDLGTNASLVQLSLTFFLLGLSLGQLVVGPFSDIRGRRIPLLIGLLVYSSASLLCALSPSIEALLFFRFAQGLAGSAGIVLSRAIVRDLYSGSELTKFFSLLMLVNGLGPILAPIIGAKVLQFTSWHGVFVVLSIVGTILLITVSFWLPETLPKERRMTGGFKGTIRTFRQLLANRTFMGYAISQGLVFASMFAYISGSSFVFQNVFGVTPQMYSYIFALNGLGIILATQVTGRLAGRIGETTLLMIGLRMSALGGSILLIMLLLKASLFAVLPPLFFVVSSVGVVNTAGFSLAMQTQSKVAGSAAALLGVTSLLIAGLFAPLVGLGGSHTALPMGIVIACSSACSVLAYTVLVREKKQEAA